MKKESGLEHLECLSADQIAPATTDAKYVESTAKIRKLVNRNWFAKAYMYIKDTHAMNTTRSTLVPTV